MMRKRVVTASITSFEESEFVRSIELFISILEHNNLDKGELKEHLRILLDNYAFAAKDLDSKHLMARKLLNSMFASGQDHVVALKFLEEKYDFDVSPFVAELTGLFFSRTKRFAEQNSVEFLLNMITFLPKERQTEVLFFQQLTESSDGGMVSASILEIMTGCLDLNNKQVQRDMIALIISRGFSAFSAGFKLQVLHGIITLECSKETNWSPQMVNVFLNNTLKLVKDAEDLSDLYNLFYKRIFLDLGFDFKERLTGEKISHFKLVWEKMMAHALDKDPEYKHISFHGLVMFLSSVCKDYEENSRDLLTKVVFSNFETFSEKDINFLRSNRRKFLSLGSVAPLIGVNDAQDEKLANFLCILWSGLSSEIWGDITSISSPERVVSIIEFLHSSAKCEAVFLKPMPAIENHLSGHYYIYRSYLALRQENGFLEEYAKVRNRIEQTPENVRAVSLVKIQSNFLFYLHTTFGQDGRIPIRSLPPLLELDIGFLSFLAEKHSFLHFAEVFVLFVQDSQFPELVTALKDKFAVFDMDSPAYHYSFIIDKLIANMTLFKDDSPTFIRSILAATLDELASEDHEIKQQAISRLRCFHQDESMFSGTTKGVSDEQMIFEMKSALVAVEKSPVETGKSVKQQKRNLAKARSHIAEKMVKEIAEVSEFKNEEELYSVLGERKSQKREDNIQMLKEHFFYELNNTTNNASFAKYKHILGAIFNAQEKLLKLKHSEAEELGNLSKEREKVILLEEHFQLVEAEMQEAKKQRQEMLEMQEEDLASEKMRQFVKDNSYYFLRELEKARCREGSYTASLDVLQSKLSSVNGQNTKMSGDLNKFSERLHKLHQENVSLKQRVSEQGEELSISRSAAQEYSKQHMLVLEQKAEVEQNLIDSKTRFSEAKLKIDRQQAVIRQQEDLREANAEVALVEKENLENAKQQALLRAEELQRLLEEERSKSQNQREYLATKAKVREESMNQIFCNLLNMGIDENVIAFQKAYYDVEEGGLYKPVLNIAGVDYASPYFKQCYTYHHASMVQNVESFVANERRRTDSSYDLSAS